MSVGWRQVWGARARHSLATRALVPFAALCLGAAAARAQDATWVGGTSNQWGDPTNWTPAAVPTGTATFDTSAQTGVQAFFESTGAIDFTATSSTYTITLEDIFNLSGAGVSNDNPGVTQTFILDSAGSPVVNFLNASSASAGAGAVTYQNQGNQITFNSTSTLGSATIVNQGDVEFNDSSSAGTGILTNSAVINFNGASTAGSAQISNSSTGTLTFNNTSTAGSAIFTSTGNGTITFNNSASAGTATFNSNPASFPTYTFNDTSTASGAIFPLVDASLVFNSSSTAGSALITMPNVMHPGNITFNDTSTAGSANITNVAVTALGTSVQFLSASTAGNATIVNNPNSAVPNAGGLLYFGTLGGTDTANAGTANITNNQFGSTSFLASTSASSALIINNLGGNTNFQDQSTAAGATIVNNNGGTLNFGVPIVGTDTATAGNANITNNLGGTINFNALTTAGSATITNLAGGSVFFADSSTGGNARFINIGGTFDMSGLTTDGMTIGSIEGDGFFFLGSKQLTIGSNNLSTTVTSALTDGGVSGGTGASLIKIGTGMLTLDGVNTYTGGTTIGGGTLEIGDIGHPGASIAGNATVDAGGTLSGHGTIFGSVTVAGGTLAPGGTIGVMTIAGNYTQGSAGTLSIEVSPTAASQLKVGGAATLAGTLALVFDPGVYSATSYKIVTASSVSGAFTTVTGTNPTGLPQSILYDPADVTLQLSALPATPAPLVVAPTNDTIYTDLASTLVMNAQQANGIILDRLGNRPSGIADGEVALGGLAPGLQYAQAGNAAVIGDLASALPQALASQGAWFRGIGGFATVNGNPAAPGFTGTAGGFLAGFDRPVGENVYLGVAGGYLHSGVNEHSTGSSGTADTGRLALYGGAFLGPSLLTATAGYAHDWIDTSRGLALGTAIEGHGANEATVAGQWSLPLTVQGVGQGIATLTPKAGFQFLHLGETGFSETGASGLDLSSAGHATDSFQPFVELAASQKFITADGTLFTPELRLGYDREALSGSRTLTVATVSGAFFPVTGVKPSKNMATAGAGLTVQAGPALSLYATYDAVLPTGNTIDQTVQAGLRLKF
jgi:fibronectin-binding autotransporter adhesin